MKKEITFKTSGELADHLRNVGDVYNKEGYRLYFDAAVKDGSPFKASINNCRTEPLGYSWRVDKNKYYTKLPWEDCIPEGKGVPCYVKDYADAQDKGCPQEIIIRFNPKDGYPYVGVGASWRYATPIPADKLWVPDND